MLLGLIVGLGVTKFLSISFTITLIYVILHRRRITIPKSLWIVCACILITAIWSPEPGKPVLQVCAILLGWLSYKALPRHWFRLGIYAILLVQLGFMIWQYSEGMDRLNGISRNASVLGLSGMWLAPSLIAAIVAGGSISRTAMLGIAIYGYLFRSSRRATAGYVALALTCFVVVTLISNPDRLGISGPRGINNSAVLRIDTITGHSNETLPDIIVDSGDIKPVAVRTVQWHWYGYGFGQFYFQTGQIQPHNIFARTWYELGIFSIPFFYALLWFWADHGRDWKFMALAVATGMLTDELLGSLEGVYMILGYAIMRESADR